MSVECAECEQDFIRGEHAESCSKYRRHVPDLCDCSSCHPQKQKNKNELIEKLDMSWNDGNMVKFWRGERDKLEVELETLLGLIGMSRREWDTDKERLECKSPKDFMQERISRMIGQGQI